MAKEERGKVWLGVAGLVINRNGEWLVVKKRYSGLKGRWSLPAGFVNKNETVDEAVLREVQEETGVACTIQKMIGFRSGVIRHTISDNMAIFLLTPNEEEPNIQPQLTELLEVKWIHPNDLRKDGDASVMLHELANNKIEDGFRPIEGVNPGDVFGYSSYKLFF